MWHTVWDLKETVTLNKLQATVVLTSSESKPWCKNIWHSELRWNSSKHHWKKPWVEIQCFAHCVWTLIKPLKILVNFSKLRAATISSNHATCSHMVQQYRRDLGETLLSRRREWAVMCPTFWTVNGRKKPKYTRISAAFSHGIKFYLFVGGTSWCSSDNGWGHKVLMRIMSVQTDSFWEIRAVQVVCNVPFSLVLCTLTHVKEKEV